LTIAGGIVLLVVGAWLTAILIRGVIRHDNRVRAARRASEG
jgi:energy-converting hydrogenase Eha subunit E